MKPCKLSLCAWNFYVYLDPQFYFAGHFCMSFEEKIFKAFTVIRIFFSFNSKSVLTNNLFSIIKKKITKSIN